MGEKIKRKKRVTRVFLLLLLCVSMLLVPGNASEATKNGWVKKTYYYKNGKMVKNRWLTVKNKKYYFGKNGKVKKGVAVIKEKFYYFNKSNGSLNTTKTRKPSLPAGAPAFTVILDIPWGIPFRGRCGSQDDKSGNTIRHLYVFRINRRRYFTQRREAMKD